MELKTFVCPNCGANTTNAQNCEYCGSLLVRFVEKGIDLSHTTYTNNDAVFPGLIQELKRNLKMQDENPNTGVATDLYKMMEDGSTSGATIMSELGWPDGTVSPEFQFQRGKKQLCIAVDFSTCTDAASYKEFNDKVDNLLAKFRQLDSFPLFTPHSGAFVDPLGISRYGRKYAINFGTDAEGAARLVSEILIKVMGWSPTEPFDMFTNAGNNNIERARKDWNEAHGFSYSTNNNSGCAGIIIAFIAFIGTALYFI